MSKLTILGSINIDIVQETPRLPKIGETMLSGNVNYFLGGKGANQSVAASRVDGNVDFIACIGNDSFGKTALKHLNRENIHSDNIIVKEGAFTGIATIIKLPTDNSILVSSGANFLFDDSDLKRIEHSLENANVFLTQLEVPLPIIKKSLQLAKAKDILTIVNPAPYTNINEILPLIDIMTPNETEFEGLVGCLLDTNNKLENALLKWHEEHMTKLILTRGSNGVSFVENNKVITIPSINVNVVDTTGAGDTFNGILATLLSKKEPLALAIKKASIGASLSVERFGAQTGMPTIEKINTHITNSIIM